MRMSVREARAQFAAAIAAAERGERVTITKNGIAVAELGPSRSDSERAETVWERITRVRSEMGLDRQGDVGSFDEEWRKAFDDPALGREVLGLGDDWRATDR